MNEVMTFVSNLGFGPAFAFPFVLTLIVVVAWYALDETIATDLDGAIKRDN